MEDGGTLLFGWVMPVQRANPKSSRVVGSKGLRSDSGGVKE